MLPHKDVVREIILLGQWRGEAAIFPVPASEAELAEAAIVQAAEIGADHCGGEAVVPTPG